MSSLWEIKDALAKVKAAVLNYTEYEQKTHDATSNDAWGAPTTLLAELAAATASYQHFQEILPVIYSRFTDKEPYQWRQIYKSLVLLEYLVKNGAERCVDDARGRLGLIKGLRYFQYVDDVGKDQGINVRKKASDLVALLTDTDMIKEERKRARENRKKMQSGPSFSTGGGGGGGGKYGGFGSEAYFAGATPSFDRGGLHGDSIGASSSRKYDAEEYSVRSRKWDADDVSSDARPKASLASQKEKKVEKAEPPKQPEVSLLDFGDDVAPAATETAADDDDWGDFAGASSEPIASASADTPVSSTFVQTTLGSKTSMYSIAPLARQPFVDGFGDFATATPSKTTTSAMDLLSFDIGATTLSTPNASTPLVGTNGPPTGFVGMTPLRPMNATGPSTLADMSTFGVTASTSKEPNKSNPSSGPAASLDDLWKSTAGNFTL